MSEAVLVVPSLGDPGVPGDVVTLADLDACRTQPRSQKEVV
jgi:hypothetical protein